VARKVKDIMADAENPSESRPARRDAVISRDSFVGRTTQFLRDVRAELRRVTWPGFDEVKNTTIITLIAVIFFAVYLFLVDRVWAFLLTQLNHLLNSITGG
jgi:preprotein translocase subunit SecE